MFVAISGGWRRRRRRFATRLFLAQLCCPLNSLFDCNRAAVMFVAIDSGWRRRRRRFATRLFLAQLCCPLNSLLDTGDLAKSWGARRCRRRSAALRLPPRLHRRPGLPHFGAQIRRPLRVGVGHALKPLAFGRRQHHAALSDLVFSIGEGTRPEWRTGRLWFWRLGARRRRRSGHALYR
jgi:hypothetical protein